MAGRGMPSADLNLLETRFVALPKACPEVSAADLEFVEVLRISA